MYPRHRRMNRNLRPTGSRRRNPPPYLTWCRGWTAELAPGNAMSDGKDRTMVNLERKERRGFASMSPEKQREIASKGGRAAHQKGTAHEWTSEEARSAGRKGGQVSRGGRGRLITPVETPAVAAGSTADAGATTNRG